MIIIENEKLSDGTPGTEPLQSSTPTPEKPRTLRGFAAMDPRTVSEFAKRGGQAAHRAGTAHQFTSDEARVAGRKGGMATHAKRQEKAYVTPH
jgi:general stress protein YciG